MFNSVIKGYSPSFGRVTLAIDERSNKFKLTENTRNIVFDVDGEDLGILEKTGVKNNRLSIALEPGSGSPSITIRSHQNEYNPIVLLTTSKASHLEEHIAPELGNLAQQRRVRAGIISKLLLKIDPCGHSFVEQAKNDALNYLRQLTTHLKIQR